MPPAGACAPRRVAGGCRSGRPTQELPTASTATTTTETLSRPPARTAAATSASAAACGSAWPAATRSISRVVELVGQPVAAHDEALTRASGGSTHRSGVGGGVRAERAGDDVAHRVLRGLGRRRSARHPSARAPPSGRGSPGSHPLVGQPVDPRVADVEHHPRARRPRRLTDGEPGDGGAHPPLPRVPAPASPGSAGSPRASTCRDVLGLRASPRLEPGERLDGEPARHLPRGVAAHAVGDGEDQRRRRGRCPRCGRAPGRRGWPTPLAHPQRPVPARTRWSGRAHGRQRRLHGDRHGRAPSDVGSGTPSLAGP